MNSSILGHLCQPCVSAAFAHVIWNSVFWHGLGAGFACRAALAKGELEREAKTDAWFVQVSNTQLDSLLHPRHERSATWAPPCCDLAPFGDSESCTHVDVSHNNAPEALQTASPIHALFSQPSTQFTFVCHWQLVFMCLANSPIHRGTGFSIAGVFSILWYEQRILHKLTCVLSRHCLNSQKKICLLSSML